MRAQLPIFIPEFSNTLSQDLVDLKYAIFNLKKTFSEPLEKNKVLFIAIRALGMTFMGIGFISSAFTISTLDRSVSLIKFTSSLGLAFFGRELFVISQKCSLLFNKLVSGAFADIVFDAKDNDDEASLTIAKKLCQHSYFRFIWVYRHDLWVKPCINKWAKFEPNYVRFQEEVEFLDDVVVVDPQPNVLALPIIPQNPVPNPTTPKKAEIVVDNTATVVSQLPQDYPPADLNTDGMEPT